MACSSNGLGALTLGTIGAIGLYNNSPDGSWFVIWDLQVVADPGGTRSSPNVLDINIMGGISAFSPVGPHQPSAPLVGGLPQPPGFIWGDEPLNEQGKNIYSLSLIQHGSQGVYEWAHEWPMAAIPVGSSFVCYTDANATSAYGATIVWEVTKYI